MLQSSLESKVLKICLLNANQNLWERDIQILSTKILWKKNTYIYLGINKYKVTITH